MGIKVKRAGGSVFAQHDEGIKFMHSSDLVEKLEAGESIDKESVGILKTFDTEIKAVADGENAILFSVSSEDVDRDNDTISMKGWNLKNYKKNPVVLWAHSYSMLPVGRSKKIYAEDGKLKSLAEFTPQDLNPFGYMVYQLLAKKFLNATSVGFRATDYEYVVEEDGKGNVVRRGIDFKKQELLEYSVVPVPANPTALVEARRMGIDTTELKSWAESLLDNYDQDQATGLIIPKGKLEELRKEADPKQTTSAAVKGTEEDKATVKYTCCFKDHSHETESDAKTCIEGTTEEIINEKANIGVNEDGEYFIEVKDTKFALRDEYIEALKKKGVEFDLEKDASEWFKTEAVEEKIEEEATDEKDVVAETEEKETEATTTTEDAVKAIKGFDYASAHAKATVVDIEVDMDEVIKQASIDDLFTMCAYHDVTAIDAAYKENFKLVHHDGTDEKNAVWDAVSGSMAALMGAKGGVSIPNDDRRTVYDHLAKHYEEFGKKAPEFRFIESQVLRHMPDMFTFDYKEGTVTFTEKDVASKDGEYFLIEEGLVKEIKYGDIEDFIQNTSSNLKALVASFDVDKSCAFAIGECTDEEAAKKAGDTYGIANAVGTSKGRLVYCLGNEKKVEGTDHKDTKSDSALEELEDLILSIKDKLNGETNRKDSTEAASEDEGITQEEFKTMLDGAQKKLQSMILGRLD